MTGKNQEQIQLLLKKLASDDEFRAAFEANPIPVLAKFGIDVDAKTAPATVTLPSKDEIAKNFDTLSQEMHATMAVVIFSK
jgi:putative modified peptide